MIWQEQGVIAVSPITSISNVIQTPSAPTVITSAPTSIIATTTTTTATTKLDTTLVNYFFELN